MNRRDLIVLFGGATAWPLVALAQSEGMRRVGALIVWPEGDPEAQAQIAAFRDGLRSLGWAEGRNIILDIRCRPSSCATKQHNQITPRHAHCP